jgi:hypothetical protein
MVTSACSSCRLWDVNEQAQATRESLGSVLGGRKSALDASAPPLAFVIGWLIFGQSIGGGAWTAIGVAALVGIIRLVRGDKIRAVAVSLTAVIAAAVVALHTGRAADFFLIQVLSNVASALLWAASVAIRWPLLGVVVGIISGQKTKWRKDSALLKAYSWATMIWSLQYVLRVLVYVPLWWSGELIALGIARTILTWPLQAVTVALSGWVLYRVLPADHPGLRVRVEAPETDQPETG